jgi:hypothetical protein
MLGILPILALNLKGYVIIASNQGMKLTSALNLGPRTLSNATLVVVLATFKLTAPPYVWMVVEVDVVTVVVVLVIWHVIVQKVVVVDMVVLFAINVVDSIIMLEIVKQMVLSVTTAAVLGTFLVTVQLHKVQLINQSRHVTVVVNVVTFLRIVLRAYNLINEKFFKSHPSHEGFIIYETNLPS